MAAYTDDELLKLYLHGDNPDYAFNLIVRKYQQMVYWHVRRLVVVHEDANDIVQEVFIKAWSALKKFRGESGLFTWLYRIATNESLTFLNRKRKRFFIPMVDVEQQLSEKLETDPYYEGNDMERVLQQAILTLPEKQRLVFLLRYYDEMKYEEMAKILDTSEGALKASYHHAVKKIEKFINT